MKRERLGYLNQRRATTDNVFRRDRRWYTVALLDDRYVCTVSSIEEDRSEYECTDTARGVDRTIGNTGSIKQSKAEDNGDGFEEKKEGRSACVCVERAKVRGRGRVKKSKADAPSYNKATKPCPPTASKAAS